MKPITKTTEDVVEELLEKRTKPISDKLDEISTRLTSKVKEEKIEDVINKMKGKAPERIVRDKPYGVPYGVTHGVTGKTEDVSNKTENISNKTEDQTQKVQHDDIFCPSCNKGHVHKLDSTGLTMQCTDGSCGERFFVIPESADHTCSTCGFPLKKPADDKTLDACPFCHNNTAQPIINGKPALKFDFTRMKR